MVVVQSSTLLLCADGMANEAVARECSTTPDIAAGSGMYYFYVADPEFGPGFIKVCTTSLADIQLTGFPSPRWNGAGCRNSISRAEIDLRSPEG